jgi:hypothetical protein
MVVMFDVNDMVAFCPRDEANMDGELSVVNGLHIAMINLGGLAIGIVVDTELFELRNRKTMVSLSSIVCDVFALASQAVLLAISMALIRVLHFTPRGQDQVHKLPLSFLCVETRIQ